MNELVRLGDGGWLLVKLMPSEHGGVCGRPIKMFPNLEMAKKMRDTGLIEFRVSEWSALRA